MFLKIDLVTKKEILNELATIVALMDTPHIALPVKAYVQVSTAMGFEEFYKPETMGGFLISNAVGIGNLTSKPNGRKQLGAYLLPSSTWSRYNAVFQTGEQSAITVPTASRIITVMEQLKQSVYHQFLVTIIDFRMTALRNSIRYMMYFNEEKDPSKPRVSALAIVDLQAYFAEARLTLQNMNDAHVHQKKNRARRSVETLMGVCRKTLARTPEEVMSKAESLLVSSEHCRSVNCAIPIRFPGVLCVQAAEDIKALGKNPNSKLGILRSICTASMVDTVILPNREDSIILDVCDEIDEIDDEEKDSDEIDGDADEDEGKDDDKEAVA